MYQQIIEAYSRIKKTANRTPVFTSRTLDNIIGSKVFIKTENFQRGGAFKFRGAFNAISLLSKNQKEKGIVTHSSGNHAQAVAIVGKLLQIKTVIVMPKNAPKVKVEATRGYGAEVVFSESTIESREKECNKLTDTYGYTLIHPYDNDNVIAGAGTTGLEFVEETGPLDCLICPVGGGGLISGISIYSKKSQLVSKVIGAEPEKADDAYRSYIGSKLIISHTPNTIADGLRTLLSERTFNYIRQNVDDIITVSEKEIIQAMKFYWERMKLVVEPSGAVSLAVLMKLGKKNMIEKDSKIGIIISGGNIDLTEFFENLTNSI